MTGSEQQQHFQHILRFLSIADELKTMALRSVFFNLKTLFKTKDLFFIKSQSFLLQVLCVGR